MSAGGDRTHEWTLARLGVWAAGLQDERDAEAVERHLEECSSCRAAADELRRPQFPEDSWGQHLPASVLATWDRSAPRLRGMLRRLARQHLERCATCRSELKTLGYRPELEWVPEMEERASQVARDRGRVVRSQGAGAWIRWRPAWGAPFAAGFAAVAATVIVVLQTGVWRPLMQGAVATRPHPTETPMPLAAKPAPPEPPGTGSQGPSSPGSTRPPSPAPEAPILLALGPESPDALGFREAVRGGASDQRPLPAVTLDSAGAQASFRLPTALALFPDENRIEIAVVDSGGNTLRTLRASVSDLYPKDSPRELVLRQGQPVLAPGRYALVFRILPGAAGQAEERKYGFTVR